MEISLKDALADLGSEYAKIDLALVQSEIDALSNADKVARFKRDPQGYMTSALQARGMRLPDGMHFHWTDGTTTNPPDGNTPENAKRLVVNAFIGKPIEVVLLQSARAQKCDYLCAFCWIVLA